ncbi:MAG: hypothetical protein KDE62_08645 [Calditrichaeota bacterium]|nr:hypothetical protein [Calditrichota bacterium]
MELRDMDVSKLSDFVREQEKAAYRKLREIDRCFPVTLQGLSNHLTISCLVAYGFRHLPSRMERLEMFQAICFILKRKAFDGLFNRPGHEIRPNGAGGIIYPSRNQL